MFRHKPLQAPLLSHRAACLMVRAVVSWPQRAHSWGAVGVTGLHVRPVHGRALQGPRGAKVHLGAKPMGSSVARNCAPSPRSGPAASSYGFVPLRGKIRGCSHYFDIWSLHRSGRADGAAGGFYKQKQVLGGELALQGGPRGGGTGDPLRNPSPWGVATVAGSLRGFLWRTESCRGAESKL